MKSVKLFFLLLICAIIGAACGHFHDEPTKSVWSGATWIVFWLPFLGSIFFFVKAYLSSKSNSTTQTPYGGKTIDNTGNVPIYKLGYFWFGVALAAFAIIAVIVVNASR
jgi:hypothetical protein